MFSKIFYLYLVISICSAEDMFTTLYGAQGAQRVTACGDAEGARPCAGLVWRRSWVLARASCLRDYYHFYSLYVERGTVNCSHATIVKEQRLWQVTERHTHPSYPRVDLALLRLDRPYATPDLSDNHTIDVTIVNKLDTWMNNILFAESLKRIEPMGYQHPYRHHLKMYSTPLKMFLVTVVLPSSAFVVFFLFIIFFTSKNKNNKIPYKSLNGDKKETTSV